MERKASAGEIFSSIRKRAPAPVKASIIYNDLVKFWNLDRECTYIAQGDKIKWLYLKPNIYKIDAIAFFEENIPKKILDFITENVDREKVFTSVLLNKIEGFYSDLGWRLDLNPYRKVFFNFD